MATPDDLEGPIPVDLSGFTGWVTFADLAVVAVTKEAGVYIVVRPSADPPEFCADAPYRGDPAVPINDLKAGWVRGAQIVYIGKADAGVKGNGLRRRLRQFRRYGAGGSARHSGGRRIWHLADHANLLVGWRATTNAEVPGDVESDLIARFCAYYGARPFGNRRD